MMMGQAWSGTVNLKLMVVHPVESLERSQPLASAEFLLLLLRSDDANTFFQHL